MAEKELPRLTGKHRKGDDYYMVCSGVCKRDDGDCSGCDRLCDIVNRLGHLEDKLAVRPIEDYHEDRGDVLWWTFPIEEPPYVGSPLCEDWPGYHTHWTEIICPKDVEEA